MLIRALSGTWRRTRTVTPVKEPDFESIIDHLKVRLITGR